MQSYDVIIVGAGPAGSTCAGLLTDGGLSVLLIDRDRFPREKPCAGWVTPAVFETLRIDPGDYGKKHLLQCIREFRSGVIYGKEIATDYARTVSYGIRRSEFDDFLMRRSKAATMLGEQVRSVERTGDGWVVNGTLKARLVIGAGGHRCPVAAALGARPANETAIVAMVAEMEMSGAEMASFRMPKGCVALYFTREMTGYGWLFRKGDYLNVGLGAIGSRDIRSQVTAFCRSLSQRGELPEGVQERLRGHAYLPYRKEGGRTMVGDRALVIGDAAGLSYPESGEGILPAVESASLAAQTVLSASGDYRQEKLEPYVAALRKRFAGLGGSSMTLPAGIKEFGGAAILSSRWLTRRLVLDRWFLHRAKPVLPDGWAR